MRSAASNGLTPHLAIAYHHKYMRTINQPVSWWGWHWTPSMPMSIAEIIKAGSMSPRLAAAFWVAMERGASLIVAADPPTAGKTTTLTALLPFTLPNTAAYFTRGIGEAFGLPPPSTTHPTYMLINEMSDHLPVYTWGSYARRAFELLDQGYSLATTMHANSPTDVLAILEEDLAIPRRLISHLTFIVSLHLGYRGSMVRRVAKLTFLRPDVVRGFAPVTLARWNPEADTFSIFPSAEARREYARWADLTAKAMEKELDRREAFLEGLLSEGSTEIPAVNQAIEAYYREVILPNRRGKR
jgi:hypothetical protein